MGQVRVAVVGVGNCAASLVQGVTYYADADPATRVPGLMHVDFGGYHVRDIESTPRRSVRTSPRRSPPARTTPSRSPTSHRPA
jgi:hypothetical protein